ncbi:MAG: COX15/CtaA family protein [Owenweeksia sp.]|nr:COX15/CtaA family protein [Owenweeksia sp.]
MYTKHDYAQFNPSHTWTEYINRLLGALSGVPMLLLVGAGLFYVGKDWRILALALVGLFLLGFEAWLGKLVVDGNLIPGSITIHMMGALSIVAVLMVLLGLNLDFPKIRYTAAFRNVLLVALLLSLFQIILGTQVREQVDILKQADMARANWVQNLDWQFYFHRSFSILILLTNAWLWWQNRKRQFGFKEMTPIMLLLMLEILLGVILNYLGMPGFAQPLHLLLGTILLVFQIFAVVRLAQSQNIRVIEVQ